MQWNVAGGSRNVTGDKTELNSCPADQEIVPWQAAAVRTATSSLRYHGDSCDATSQAKSNIFVNFNFVFVRLPKNDDGWKSVFAQLLI